MEKIIYLGSKFNYKIINNKRYPLNTIKYIYIYINNRFPLLDFIIYLLK